ncbi:MAG: hypothetical protein G01um101430_51 [Parcubacteria group bacterium Gr01-1014_30]|nr:MAG: hypothetical protein G01um101430_51 [Parcubacteria group bacterium Gr01-1014_30]
MPRNTTSSAFFQRETQNRRRRLEDDIRGMGKIFWTTHSKQKMRYYQLSEKRVLRVLRKPNRKEEGIVDGTIANMQIAGTKKRPTEVWTMYVILKRPKGVKIISAWRYPGRTPQGQRPIIPDDVLKDILKEHLK